MHRRRMINWREERNRASRYDVPFAASAAAFGAIVNDVWMYRYVFAEQ
jgi:hypothetical protein